MVTFYPRLQPEWLTTPGFLAINSCRTHTIRALNQPFLLQTGNDHSGRALD